MDLKLELGPNPKPYSHKLKKRRWAGTCRRGVRDLLKRQKRPTKKAQEAYYRGGIGQGLDSMYRIYDQ